MLISIHFLKIKSVLKSRVALVTVRVCSAVCLGTGGMNGTCDVVILYTNYSLFFKHHEDEFYQGFFLKSLKSLFRSWHSILCCALFMSGSVARHDKHGGWRCENRHTHRQQSLPVASAIISSPRFQVTRRSLFGEEFEEWCMQPWIFSCVIFVWYLMMPFVDQWGFVYIGYIFFMHVGNTSISFKYYTIPFINW